MARHLLVGGTNIAPSYTNGVLGAGQLDIQVQFTGGPAALTPGEGVADAELIRFVQGPPSGIGANIVSPWIHGRDIITAGGLGSTAQAAQVSTITITASSVEAGTLYVKLIDRTDGESPFTIKNYEVAIAASAAQNDIATAINTAINADLPSWIASSTVATNVVTITGQVRDADNDYGTIFELADDQSAADDDGLISGLTVAFATTTPYSPGAGDGYHLKKMEEELRGTGYGYYNRLELPIAPTTSVDPTDAYDMYHLVVGKKSKFASEINGVDNRIEIYIAIPDGASAQGVFQNKLNGYLASLDFPAIDLI